MDFLEKQQMIRRICSGKLYTTVSFNNISYDVVFRDPNQDLQLESDWIYNRVYKRLKEEGALTLEESYDILKQDGKWSDELEKEMKTIDADLENLKSHLQRTKFNKTEQAAIKVTIEKGRQRLLELDRTKNQLIRTTSEFIAMQHKRRFLISHITTVPKPELLDVLAFKDTLSVYYFEESGISESQIRKLARSDPWRLYWTTSKDTGTPLFPHPTVEMTDLQYMLVLWTRIYDFAYNSMNRPTDDVIEDDVRFEAWYHAENERIQSEIKRNDLERSLGKTVSDNRPGSIEIFLPADEEGAKEVYNLNTPESRARVVQRQKALTEKGELPEAKLPDVSRDLKMELNRLSSQEAQNRSR